VVAEKGHGKRFTATFRAGVILRMCMWYQYIGKSHKSCVVFNTGPYTVLPDNSILITANMQWETGFPSSHPLKSYVASKSHLKLAAHAVLSADAGLLVDFCFLSTSQEIGWEEHLQNDLFCVE